MKIINKRLDELQAKIKPGQKVYVWRVRGDFFVNQDGEKFKQKEDLPDGENIINIIVESV